MEQCTNYQRRYEQQQNELLMEKEEEQKEHHSRSGEQNLESKQKLRGRKNRHYRHRDQDECQTSVLGDRHKEAKTEKSEIGGKFS